MNLLEKLYLTGAEVLPSEPLSRHTSLAVGGPAKALILPNSVSSMIDVMRILMSREENFKIMGMGTNLLVSDDGIDDFVVKTTRLGGHEIVGDLMVVESGISLKRACELAMEEGLTGLEELYGIPGSVGGAVYMNAGAYGKEVKDVLEWVELFDGENVERFSSSDLKMSYRKTEIGNRMVIKAAFKLRKSNVETVRSRMKDFLKRRLEKQPVFERSAGSLFKRPRKDFYMGSAIERLGLKGYGIGGMKISEKHAGFLVNTGKGNFKDAMKLVEHVRKKILEVFGQEVEMEVIVWK